MRSITFALATVLAAMLGTSQAASIFGGLEGHSVVAELKERLDPLTDPIDQLWTEHVFFAGSGKIFTKHNEWSQRAENNNSRSMISDGSLGGSPFLWNGYGVSREWPNTKGITLRQTIQIFRNGSGFGCKMSVVRLNVGTQAQVLSQTCRVEAGNSAAD